MRKSPLGAQIERTGNVLATTADHQTRTIFLFGDIDDTAAYRFSVVMSVMDRTRGPISVRLNTGGGEVEAGYAIYDAIRYAANHVTVVGYGGVQSMGAIIIQAADTRLMTERARMMIHSGHLGFEGGVDADKLISIGREMDKSREADVAILSSRASITPKQVRALILEESYFSPHEALELGFIDGILVAPSKPATHRKGKNR